MIYGYNPERTILMIGSDAYIRQPAHSLCEGCAFTDPTLSCTHPGVNDEDRNGYHKRGCFADNENHIWVKAGEITKTHSDTANALPTFKQLFDAANLIMHGGKPCAEFRDVFGGTVVLCDFPWGYIVPTEEVMDYDRETGVAVVRFYNNDGDENGSYSLKFTKTRPAI